MDLTIMIVAVVAIILVFALVITLAAFKHEEKRMGLSSGGGDVARLEQDLAATQAEVGKLRNRVQVLEKLVTDDDRKLAGEIERLRSEERV